MKYFWQQKSKSDDLIVFFNGWANDEKPFAYLVADNYDVLILYDYSDLSIDAGLLDIINSYKNTTVIGWSMGVWALASCAGQIKNIAKSIALNGTFKPKHDKFGIPAMIYEGTVKNWNEENRDKFYKRMFINSEEFEKYMANQPSREAQDQKNELIELDSKLESGKVEFEYDCVIISTRDKIIPTRNQKNFWSHQINVKSVEAGHFPFYRWKSWNELIEYASVG